jgi:hypothetical protein
MFLLKVIPKHPVRVLLMRGLGRLNGEGRAGLSEKTAKRTENKYLT